MTAPTHDHRPITYSLEELITEGGWKPGANTAAKTWLKRWAERNGIDITAIYHNHYPASCMDGAREHAKGNENV